MDSLVDQESLAVVQEVECSEVVNINDLVDDCLIQIFEYLSLEEKLKLEIVNKRFNTLSKKSWNYVNTLKIDKYFKNKYLLDKNETRNTDFISLIIRRCGKYLNSLYFNGIDTRVNWSKVINESATYCENITDIELTWIDVVSTETLYDLFEKNKRIKNLCLRCLKLNSFCLTSLNPGLIEELNLDDCEIDLNKNFLNFLSHLKNLKKLRTITYTSDNFIDFVIDALNIGKIDKLSELSVTSGGISISEKLNELLIRQKELRSICLQKVSENSVDILLSLTNLEKISIEFISSTKFLNALNNFTNLKSFYVTTDDFNGFLQYLVNCISLKELEFHLLNSFHITPDGGKCLSKLENIESLKFNLNDEPYMYSIEEQEELSCQNFFFISKCKKLKKLYICNMYFELKLNEFEFPNLEVFVISSSNISNQIFATIVLKSPKLKYCKFISCLIININNELVNLLNGIKKGQKKDKGDTHILYIEYFDTKIDKNSLTNLSPFLCIKELL